LVGETNWTDVIAYGSIPYVSPHPEPGHAVALLRNAEGRTCKIETSYVLHRPYLLYFNLFGSQGTFETSRTEPAGLFFSDRIPFMNQMEKLAVPYATRPGHRQAGHGSSETHMVADLVQAIRQDRPAAISTREAARSIAPAICALESIRTGERVAIPQF
jgi:predicted dehydrogenase